MDVRVSRGAFSALHRHRSSATVLGYFLGISLGLPQGLSYALPTDYGVEHGNVSAEQTDPQTLHLHIESDQAVLQYPHFDIAQPERVEFHHHEVTPTSGVLARVTGGQPSEIGGRLLSNGQLFLVNPAGIHTAATAVIDVAKGFVASTLELRPLDFLSGKLRFERMAGQSPKAVVNEGRILTDPGGFISLLGGAVVNQGSLVAELGTVALAAGEKITLSFDPEGQLAVAVEEPLSEVATGFDGKPVSAAIQQQGEISAPSGQVLVTAKAVERLFDQVVNQSGLIEANRVVDRGGRIELVGEGGTVAQTGTLRADGTVPAPDGGQIFLKGTRIVQRGTVTADTEQAGRGGDIQVIAVKETVLDTGSLLRVRGGAPRAQGGSIWINTTEGHTSFRPTAVLDVSAGPMGGDAGFVELSGQTVQWGGQIVGQAQEGFLGGRLLVDPLNLIFDTSSQSSPTNNTSPTPDIAFDAAPSSGTTTIQISDITGFSEARFEATQDITVNNTLRMGNNNDLVFLAGRHINLNANVEVRGSNGDMVLIADNDFSSRGGAASDGVGTITQAVGSSILSGNGGVTLQTGGDFTVRAITGGGSGSVSIQSLFGNILDDGSSATAIATQTLTLTANASGKGVGVSGALNTDVDTLNLNVGSGGAAVRDIGSFTLNGPTVASGGSLDLRADNNLTVASSSAVVVAGSGTLTLIADSDSNGNGKLTMNSGSSLSTATGGITLTSGENVDLRTVSSTSGNITALARDDVRIRQSLSTGGSGTVSLTADSEGNGSGTYIQDSGSTVSTGGGNITIQGADNLTVRTISAGIGNLSITATSGSHINDDGDDTTKIAANALTLTAGGRIGNTGSNQVDCSVNTLTATASNGSIFLANDQALTLASLTTTNGSATVTSTGDMTLGSLNIDGAVTLTSGGSLFDGNGSNVNLTANGDSSLLAVGVIGTLSDPIEVSVTGASLGVSASSEVSGVSADLSGTVSPSNTLNLLSSPPGQVIFNGQVIFPLAAAPAPAPSPSPVGPAPATTIASTATPVASVLKEFFNQLSSSFFVPESQRRTQALTS